MRLLLAIFVANACAAAACSGPPAPTASWQELSGTPAPTSTDADAAAAFEAATAQYEAADFAAALESFRLFGAEHPTDPLAIQAEIYAARTQAAMGDTLAAETAFRSLYDAPDGAATRRTAALYLAFVRAQRGETQFAIEFLVDALASDAALGLVPGWIIAGDEARLAALLAEARWAASGDLTPLADLAVVAEMGDEALRDYAVDRAAEFADEQTDVRALQAAFDSGSVRAGVAADERADFVIAAIAPTLAQRRAAAGDLDGAREVLLRAEDATLRWGRPERLAEISESLVASQGDIGTVRYGVALSLTGPTRRAGRAALGAILLAQRVFESRDPLSTVVIRDTQGTAAGTQRAVDELVATGCSVILGPIEADLSDVARRAAHRQRVPLITLSAVPHVAHTAGTYRWLIDAQAEAARVVEEAIDSRGVTEFAIVTQAGQDATGFMQVFADAAAREIAARGGQVVERTTLSYDADDASVAQQSAGTAAGAVAASTARGVVLALPDDLTATFVAYMASENVWPASNGSRTNSHGRRQMSYLINSFSLTDRLLTNSSDYVEGALFAAWFSPELATGAGREFADRFAFTYGRHPGVIEAFAFDAARAARSLLLEEGVALPAEVTDRLNAGVDARGVIGPLRFDGMGNPQLRPRLYTVQQGAFVLHAE